MSRFLWFTVYMRDVVCGNAHF